MQATYVITWNNGHLRDADASVKVAGVSIAKVLEERADDFSMDTDTTVIVSSGMIQRTIVVTLTPDFLVRFPNENSRRSALKDAFKSIISMGIPGYVEDNLTL